MTRRPAASHPNDNHRVFRRMFLAAGAVLAAAVLVPSQPRAQARAADHVIVISIDGFRPAMYRLPEAEGLSVPTLVALRDAGSFADGVEVSYPSLTYPSHTSLATGARPARHGIVSNTLFDPANGSSAWYFENTFMRVPALWDLAKRAGLTTAGASWPVTVGATMDVLFPESNQAPRDMTWLARARADSTPGLIDAVVQDLGGFGENANRDAIQRDRFTAAVARRIIRDHRPNLLMIHLMETDAAQHADGPGSPAAKQAIERIDAHVGAIVRATEEAGIRARTAFVISGDHGFSRVHTLVQPNVVLRDAGLLATDGEGRLTSWQAVAHGFAIRLREPGNGDVAARAERAFETLAAGRYKGIFRVVSRAELDALGAYPDAAFFVEPAEGYYISDGFTDGAVLVGTTRRGAHGFLPTEARMHTGLVVSGAGIRPGVPLPLARQIDIAPTVARLLGFAMPEADGVPMVGILK
ncbi:MAG: ectonucleotide pyrophosphatase/phosphodiesterase [Acidobacteriota bacterium]